MNNNELEILETLVDHSLSMARWFLIHYHDFSLSNAIILVNHIESEQS